MEGQELVKSGAESEQRADCETEKRAIAKMDINDQITSLIPLAGTIELTEEQEKILYAPVQDENVEIRPDGLIYLPWMEYVTRLRKAFGMSWTLIPYGPPKKVGNFIHWAFWLIIKGKPYGFAIGEQRYFEGESMTYGDALEGCKSNALMRLCKGLGISLELWQPEFRRKWLPKYAETYPATWPDGKPRLNKRTGKQEIFWRKKGTPESNSGDIQDGEIVEPAQQDREEGGNKPPEQKNGKKSEPITDQQKRLIFARLKDSGKSSDDLEAFMGKKISEFNKYPDTNNALDWIAKDKA